MSRTTSELRRLWSPPCVGPFARVPLNGGSFITVRASTVEAWLALNEVLVRWAYEATPPDVGAYNCRTITGGTGYSLHAYGIAADINWGANPYGPTLVTDMPSGMIDDIKAIRTNSGAGVFRWGGDFSGNKDAMHFEIVASPAEIASGIANPQPNPQPQPNPNPQPQGEGVDLVALSKAIMAAKTRIYKLGMRNAEVKFIQAGINNISNRGLVVDGNFGRATDQAVRDLQKWFKIRSDGIVGPRTWNLLYPN